VGERHRITAGPSARRLGDRLAFALAALALAALATSGVGCRGRREAPRDAAPAAQAPTAPPVDRALPGEIAPGPEDAFGLPIPLRMKVRARFSDAVFASGRLAPEDVARYVRERVTPERVETSPAKTVLTHARLKSGGDKVLRIEVISRGAEAEIVVRDEARPPAKEGLTEEERWRELGLTPQGAPLDPTQLE
jgi:hypothetical protein